MDIDPSTAFDFFEETIETSSFESFVKTDIKLDQFEDTKVGFKWDNQSDSYELVTDLDLWKYSLPVERFISKVTQMYAYQTIISQTKEDGYQIVEQKNENDGSIELVLTKWEA